MSYTLSASEFKNGKMFDSNGKIKHITGNKIKLFPFITNPNSVCIESFNQLIGMFLCKIEDKMPVDISIEKLIDTITSNINIEIKDKQTFYETIKQLFFEHDEKFKPLNLHMLSCVQSPEISQEKIADYLVDVLGDKAILSTYVQEAKSKEMNSLNVLERVVLTDLKSQPYISSSNLSYFRMINTLHDIFEEDFRYIIGNQTRVREHLVDLLEFYFFTYTAQSCMQLDRFMYGERDNNIPLYFCLDWEKTSQSRRCFTEGWQRLQKSVERIFAHVVVLEILNHTEDSSSPIDYVDLHNFSNQNPDKVQAIAMQIDTLTEIYRNKITDCTELYDIEKDTDSDDAVTISIKYLFDSVKTQFEYSVRARAYDSYAQKFEKFCSKYLKSRGRNGLMLTLSEEQLIFLTKIAIKDCEQIRLNDVFEEFKKRGVYLDDISKEQVAAYYEKLNLIEKKSDSGDAKYVKRIL